MVNNGQQRDAHCVLAIVNTALPISNNKAKEKENIYTHNQF